MHHIVSDGAAFSAFRALQANVPGICCRLLWFVRLWSVLGLFIEFFREPHWCAIRSTGRCPGQDSTEFEQFYMSSFPKFGQRSLEMLMINLIYLVPFVIDLGLRVLAYGRSFWASRAGNELTIQRLYTAVIISYALVSLLEYFNVVPTFDFLAFCRPFFFLALHHSVRREVQVVLNSIPQVLELFFLGFLLLLFFSLVAIILFPITTEEGRTFFPSLLQGMWSLLVLLTTANFPDVMLPTYVKSRTSVLYFLLFMMVGMFFLVNVLTAIVMSAYQRQFNINQQRLKDRDVGTHTLGLIDDR